MSCLMFDDEAVAGLIPAHVCDTIASYGGQTGYVDLDVSIANYTSVIFELQRYTQVFAQITIPTYMQSSGSKNILLSGYTDNGWLNSLAQINFSTQKLFKLQLKNYPIDGLSIVAYGVR